MQSFRTNGSSSDQMFDMGQLGATLPQYHDSAKYRHPNYAVDGYRPPAHMFYPMHEDNRDGSAWNSGQDSGNELGLKIRSSGFPGGPGIYAFEWNSFSPRHSGQLSQSAFGTVSLSLDTSQQKSREFRRKSVPSSPRGPPRKPRRTGHALWVGNLPPSARIEELKDHFSRGATQDIESVFLISKSNCAFVNYRSEPACVAAWTRFHNSRFRGRALACRLRRTTSASGSSASELSAIDGDFPASTREIPSPLTSAIADEPPSPVIVGGNENLQNGVLSSPSPLEGMTKSIPAKYFILKSLTPEDLEASVETGFWATQPHNDAALNKAYAEAQDVFLVFSANKSGEYFGYARMTSAIAAGAQKKPSIAAKPTGTDGNSSESPLTIRTIATATAPKGLIIDDSARGSIFWEADRSDDPTELHRSQSTENEAAGNGSFALEWLSTKRIPFLHTRGMRNPCNGNREIKIARDGQELDPRVGRRLLQLFQVSPQVGQVNGAFPSAYN